MTIALGAKMLYIQLFFIFTLPLSLLANISVSPLFIDFHASSNQEEKKSIEIANHGETSITFNVYAHDFDIDTKGQETEETEASQQHGCTQFLSIQPSGQIELAPGQKQAVTLSLNITEPSPSFQWGKLFVEQVSPSAPINKEQGAHRFQLFIKQRWEVRLHQSPRLSLKKDLEIHDLQVVEEAKEEAPYMLVTVKNTGDDFLKCTGYLEIKDMQGQAIQVLPLGSQGKFIIYPQKTRILKAPLAQTLSQGSYLALAVLDYGGENLIAGELELSVGEEDDAQ